MSKGQECQKLYEKYKETGDEAVFVELLDNMQGMIRKILWPFRFRKDIEDLHQIADMTAFKCMSYYDPKGGALYTTYCFSAIYKEVKHYIEVNKKHYNEFDEYGNQLRSILYLDAGTQACESLLVADTLTSNDDVERDAIVSSMKPYLLEIADTFKTEKQKKIAKAFIEGERQVDIATKFNVSQSYISKTIKQFYEKCEKLVNR